MNKKISIIVPVYNGEKYIERCVDSLIRQTYKNIEIIIVNDGSTDDTLKILNKYAKEDNRIVVITKENSGVTETRNIGIQKSSGDYLCFCDADDWYEPDMCETLIEAIKKYNVKVAVCGYIRVEENLKTLIKGTKTEHVLTKKEAIKNIISGGLFTGSLWTKIYEKTLFCNLQIERSIKYNEDILINYLVFKKVNHVAFIDKCKYNYYIHADSSTGGADSVRANRDCLFVSEFMLNELQGSELEFYIHQRYTNVLINLYRAYTVDKRFAKERKETKEKLFQCLKTFPKLQNNLRLNIYMIKYIPFLYPLIYKIYDKIRTKNIDV